MSHPRVPLALLPTPIHRLPRLSEALGIDLWIKRDDLTGFAMGGNKARKLEYLMSAAIASHAEVIVTCGSGQSNFIRQLAAACAVCGLECACAVMPLPYEEAEPSGAMKPLLESGGNVFLDELLGAHLEWHPNGTWEELFEAAEKLAKRLEVSGKRVYRIPIGGSSPLGAFAFTQAGAEVVTQMENLSEALPDFLVTASSSGSTHTGLAMHFSGTSTRVIGVACDPEPEISEDFADLSRQLVQLEPTMKQLKADEFWLEFDYVGEGYGIPSVEGQAALKYLAQTEGIFLDPIYSAKAFAGLLDCVAKKKIGGRVLFWHTGGTPALFSLP
jgi:D-cysteine desulfhydrase family pyridoxal phosphate-dependent enzyme